MSEAKVGGWTDYVDGTWARTRGPHNQVAASEWGGGWCVHDLRGAIIASGPETGDLGRAHADAALCEHGLVPWPCAACGGECERGSGGRASACTLCRDGDRDGPEVPLCVACGSCVVHAIRRLRGSMAQRALYADGTPFLAAWLLASAQKVAPKLIHKREERAKADAARLVRLADPVVRADLDSLPRALRACADEVERSPLAMMPITTSRAVAARLRALADEVASRQEQDGYVWAGCYYVSDRAYPHERLGLVYAHRIAPSDYVALQLASWAADIPAPADPWAGWTRTSATDAAKAGAK